MRKTSLAVALLLAVACQKPAVWMGVPGGQVVNLPEGLTVAGDPLWNRLEEYKEGVRDVWWTANGYNLDLVMFFAGIQPGELLTGAKPKEGAKVPVFKEDLQPEEIVDLFDQFISPWATSFHRGRLSPASFLGGDGFRFEFSALRKGDEVAIQGVGYGAVRKGRLYLITFHAARLHYFPTLLPKVEALAKSARLAG